MSRSKRKLIAEETIEVLTTGKYVTDGGREISVQEKLQNAREGTELIRPHDFTSLTLPTNRFETRCKVVNETTFAGAKALIDCGAPDVCSLNFASAKNPGGGFLGGSQAQEEALSRASGLYPCLQTAMEYYEFHRKNGNALYSHHMIYSPGVPVFRDDADQFLDDVWCTSIITSPAVNAGALRTNNPKVADQIVPVMRERIDYVLALATAKGHRNLVLGAWGCGVFRNDPKDIAKLFADSLGGTFSGVFEQVRFSVLDMTSERNTFNAFRNALN